MKKFVFCLLLFILSFSKIFAQGTWSSSGCGGTSPTLQMVLVNGCGNEGETEYFTFTTGTAAFNVNALNGVSSSGPPFATVSGFSGANATAIITKLNMWAGCSIFQAAPNPIPANSTVWAFPNSTGLSSIATPPNLSNLCASPNPIYVVSGNYNSTGGFYTNNPPAPDRTITINFGGCQINIDYTTAIPDVDGVNISYGGGSVATYNNPGR